MQNNELLSSLFNIHASTVSRYFQKWINVMHERLKPLVKWPEHEQLYFTMPREFKNNFSKCVVIIDCFEVFMERPKGLMARAQTWSNYKKWQNSLSAFSKETRGQKTCAIRDVIRLALSVSLTVIRPFTHHEALC